MNVNNLAKYGAILAIGTLVAVSHGQVAKSGSGYLFRMKFAKGQKASYSMTMSGQMTGQKFSMAMPMAMTVTGVSGGVGTMDYKVGPMSMILNGKPVNQPPQVRNVTIKQDARGNIIGGQGAQMGGMNSIGLPAKPIRIGNTWTAKTKTASATGPMDVQATYKFIGIEQVGSRQAAKIGITMKGTGQANVTGTGTMWLAMADGSLVKTTN